MGNRGRLLCVLLAASVIAAGSLPAAGAEPSPAAVAKKKCKLANGKRAKGKKCRTKKKQKALHWGLTLTPTYLEFPPTGLGQTSATLSLTLTNTGNTPSGSLSTHLGGPNSNDFPIVSNFCERIQMPAGASCTININFSPLALGTRSVTLSVIGDQGGTDVSLLRGTGTL